MATKGVGVVKAGKAVVPVAGSNGAPAAARTGPLPAKVIRNLAALGEPHRLAVLGFVAAAAGPATLDEIIEHARITAEHATQAIIWLKRRGWLASERVPRSGGGGWTYRLSDAGRERLMALGG
jgi:DNA-binding transcriptional ArsR family regulator